MIRLEVEPYCQECQDFEADEMCIRDRYFSQIWTMRRIFHGLEKLT